MERSPLSQRRLAPPVEPTVIVGEFQRMEEIGKGSFATVFRGQHMVCFDLPYPLHMTTMDMTADYMCNKRGQARL
jgi:hypothetical protein